MGASGLVTEPGETRDPHSGPNPPLVSTRIPGSTTSSNTGTVLPIAYGLVKLKPLLIEKYTPLAGHYPYWKSAAAYNIGDWILSNGAIYTCSVAGTSAAATLTAGAWTYATVYSPGTLVNNNGWYFMCSVGGTSGSSTSPGPTLPATDERNIHDGTVTWQYVWSYSGPSGKTAGIVDGTAHWDYVKDIPAPNYLQSFIGALCEGQIVGAGPYLWVDKERLNNAGGIYLTVNRKLGVSFGSDALNQGFFKAPRAPQYFGDDDGVNYGGYQHTACLHAEFGCYTGTQTELPGLAVAIRAVAFGGETDDNVSPADIVNDLLTHNRRGRGWPSSRVDASVAGTAANAYRVYCDAAGFRFGLVIDTQRPVLSILADILSATNSDAVWSGGKLKIVPLGDVSITPSYGTTTYVPSNGSVADLGTDDFLAPVKVTCRPDADCYPEYPIEYVDRAQDYVTKTVSDPDLAYIDQFVARKAPTLSLPLIFNNGTPVVGLSRILAQRSCRCRNTYEFRLSWRYCWLEPTDVVTLTDGATGLAMTPVRITSMQEGADGLTFIAEDYPNGVSSAGTYTPQVGDGYLPQEAGSLANQAGAFDGVRLGVGAGVISPGSLKNVDTDVGKNVLTNSLFTGWTLPKTPDNSPPDGWECVYTNGWNPGLASTWVADPSLWGRCLFADGVTQSSGGYSVRGVYDSGVQHGALGLRSPWFPLIEGESYNMEMLYQNPPSAGSWWFADWRLESYQADQITQTKVWDYSDYTTSPGVWNYRGWSAWRMPAGTRWGRIYVVFANLAYPSSFAPNGTAAYWDLVGMWRGLTRIKMLSSAVAGFNSGAWSQLGLTWLPTNEDPTNSKTESNTGTGTYTVCQKDDGRFMTWVASLTTAAALASNIQWQVGIKKNGVFVTQSRVELGDGVNQARATTPAVTIPVAAGDVFTLWVRHTNSVNVNIAQNGNDSWIDGIRTR